MLKARKADAKSAGVSRRLARGAVPHKFVRSPAQRCPNRAGAPDDFVVHSLRHTMLTRLGEAGADAFTIMRIAGHSSVSVSQRYVHPTPEGLERAFEQREKLKFGEVRAGRGGSQGGGGRSAGGGHKFGHSENDSQSPNPRK
jgi:integrase